MNIQLLLEGSAPRLRQFMSDVQADLGQDGAVIGPVSDDHDPREWLPITVDVFGAADEVAALERVQPAIGVADPQRDTVRGGTTVIQQFTPPPPEESGA
jgi:hypothetical protein